MNSREWERFGEEVIRNVQEAVDSKDFSRLNRTIMDSLGGAADGIARSVRDAGGRRYQGGRYQYSQTGKNASGGGYQHRQAGENVSGGGYQYRQAGKGASGSGYRYGRQEGNTSGSGYQYGQAQEGSPDAEVWKSREKAKTTSLEPKLYADTIVAKVSGILLTVLGWTGGITFLLGAAGSAAAAVFLDVNAWAVSIICTALAAGFGIAASAGMKIGRREKRFKKYIQCLEDKEYCDIRKLAEQTGKTEKFVVKDLQKMMKKRWFRQGHLDEKKTCLMTSHSAYEQYQKLIEQTEQQKLEDEERKRQAQREREEQERRGITEEVRAVIKSGQEYIRKIHACNDDIPGEEISVKISRIEMLVDRILARVEQNPEQVSDINRMMGYYLPTTVKLLEAYADLDAQPVQGENIISSKREIEKTLDTLNIAFEKLLDDMFQDTAWDVSSDISVLHTMLAQEGLTDNGLSGKNRKQGNNR